MAKKPKRRCVIYLPEAAWRGLKVEAARRDLSAGEIILEALEARVTLVRSNQTEED